MPPTTPNTPAPPAPAQQAIAAQEKKLGRSLTKAERKQFAFTTAQNGATPRAGALRVANDLVAQVGQQLGQPLALDAAKFERDLRDAARAAVYRVCPMPARRKSRGSRSSSPTASARTWICRRCAFIRSARRRRICSAICARRQFAGRRGSGFSIIACRIIAAWSASKAGSTRNCAGAPARNPCWSTTSATASRKTFWKRPSPATTSC